MRGNGERIGPQNLPTSSIAGGIWNLLNQQRAQQRGAWPSATPAVVTDPYFMYVPLLLETGAASTRSTTVTDGAATPNTVTRNGTPSTGWTSPYQTTGYWSGQFNGSSALSLSANAAFSFSTGDFCIEAFVFVSNNNCAIVDTRSSDALEGYLLFLNSTRNLSFIYGATSLTSAASVTSNQWTHIAVTRSSGVIRLFINGVLDANTVTYASAINATSFPSIGGGRSGGSNTITGYYLNGYMSNFRMVKGSAVYTVTFTPSTTPLTAVSGTSLLTLQDNRFIDNGTANSGSGFPITVNGSPQTTPYYYPSGFTAPTASPGAGLFNATSNYLSTPDATAFNLSGGSWTIECWIYPNGTYTDFNNIVLKRGASTAWQLYLNQTTGYLSFFNLTSAYNSTSTPIANTWNHIAAVYDGTNINLYLNGTRVLQSATGNTDFSAPIYVGAFATQYQFLGYISNVRIVKGTAVYTGAFTPPSNFVTQTGGTYPSTTNVNTSIPAANTSLLLNLADSNYTSATNGVQNNTFIDSSNYAFPITRNGTPTQGAFTPYQPSGYWSNYFDGTSGQYLNTVANAVFSFGTGDFTIEGWVFPTTTSGTAPIVEIRTSAPNSTGLAFLRTSGALTLNVYTNGGFAGASTNSLILNAWNHVALVRSGNTWSYWINGVASGSFTNTSSQTDGATTGPKIGGSTTTGEVWIGYLSNIRIVKGVAVYTGAFTVPTSPLAATQSSGTNIAAITGTATSLLTCQSNRFIDNGTANSGSGFPITVNGTPKVQAFQPFSPAASYSAATYGGSGYFNGSTDYLTGTSPSMSGTWTVELWWYPITASTQQTIVSFNNGSNSGINIFRNTSNQIGVDDGLSASPIFTGGTVTTNAWNHIAIVRNGSTTTGYINGVSVGSNTFTPATVSAFQIARYNFVAFPYLCSGYISNLRVVVGTAVYTSAFTPPTTPLTAISGTSLLTNFGNAGIYDAAWQNNALTVGDAQVSTTQAQWSPTSMKFDGNGDYLTLQSNPSFAFGTNDFTIEAWIYLSAMSGDYFVISAIGAPGGFFGFRNGTDIGYGRVATAWDYNTPSGISTGSWKHIAWCRSGTNMRMFVNGTQVGATQTTSTSYNLSISNTNVGSQGANYYFNGYIQDLRLTNGYARYTANFSVPTAAFPTR
jgi:hypothetical protein